MSDSVVVLGENTSSSSEVASTSSDNTSSSVNASSEVETTAESTMTVSLDDGQYAQLCQYMATQMYISLAIFAAAALCLGVLIASQFLKRWGVR